MHDWIIATNLLLKFLNDVKRVTLDETDEVECRIKSAFLIWWYFPWEEFDVLKGLTYKAFGMDYNSTKEHLFEYLKELTEQIKYMIF